MKLVYHHRTRSTDAQRIHILEMVRAFEKLGHEVHMAELVPADTAMEDASRDAADAPWKQLVRRVPYSYDLVQLAYNLVGVPMVVWKILSTRSDFIYERYSLFNFTGMIASRLTRRPLILEVNSPFALEQHRDNEIQMFRLGAWAERVICNLSTKVIVVSSPLGRILQQSGIRKEKLETMPNGVATERFQSHGKSAEMLDRYRLRGSTVIGFVGWFRNWHGLEMLVEAFHLSALAGRNVKLLLIGDGPAMASLREIVAKHQLAESVVFTGPLPHAEVPAHLDLVDIAVQPAANEYCCPMKILEYMALGKPVVAPKQENISELLVEGQEAEFFEPMNEESLAEALRKMVEQPERTAAMGRNAAAALQSRGYLWTANAERVLRMVAAAS